MRVAKQSVVELNRLWDVAAVKRRAQPLVIDDFSFNLSFLDDLPHF